MPTLTTLDFINVCYGPYHNAQAKAWGNYTAYDIEMDIRIIADHFSCIRTYSTAYNQALIPGIAAKYNINVLLGIDIVAGTLTDNQTVIDGAIALANANSNVLAILVGNENIYPGAQDSAKLVTMIKYIKTKVSANVVVSTVQKWGVWCGTERGTLVAEVDTIFANIYPFFDKAIIGDAITQFDSDYNALVAALPAGKQIVVSETGWPTGGSDSGSAVPSIANEQTYYTAYAKHAKKKSIITFWFEMFDEPWKCFSPKGKYEDTCNESHFGIYTSGLSTPQKSNTPSATLLPVAQITTQANSHKITPFPPAPTAGVEVTFIAFGNISVALAGGSTLGPWSSGNKSAVVNIGQNVTITWPVAAPATATTTTMSIVSLTNSGDPTWQFVSGSEAGYTACSTSDANVFVAGTA